MLQAKTVQITAWAELVLHNSVVLCGKKKVLPVKSEAHDHNVQCMQWKIKSHYRVA